MVSKERLEKLVRAAMPPAATRKFLQLFYEFGRGEGFFPEKPRDLKDEELGKWMRAKKFISDNELLERLTRWIKNYGTEKIFSDFQPQGISRLPAKTLANFLLTQHGDCIAMSTALGEMASRMGFNVQYFSVEKENLDLSKMPERAKEIIERQTGGHSYVAIEGLQYDPTLGKIGTTHRGKEETREQRAADIWTNHGAFLVGMRRYKLAIKSQELALEINPRFAIAWNNKGVALDDLGEYDKAIECYDKALEINPMYEQAWNNKGAALAGLKRYAEAIKCYDKALEINPMYAKAWYNKGADLVRLERYKEAIKCAKEALRLTPEGDPNRQVMEKLLSELRKKLKNKDD